MGPEKRGYKITAVAPHVDYQQKNERKNILIVLIGLGLNWQMKKYINSFSC